MTQLARPEAAIICDEGDALVGDVVGAIVATGQECTSVPLLSLFAKDVDYFIATTHVRIRVGCDTADLDSDQLRSVYCRQTSFPTLDVSNYVEGDRDYVISEWSATVAALLQQLAPRVINRPPLGALLPLPTDADRLALIAAQAGLLVENQKQPDASQTVTLSGSQSLILVGRRSFPQPGRHAIPPEVQEACRNLAAALSLDCCEISLRVPDWSFESISITPDLAADKRALNALVELAASA